jgi:hypothetical protein
VFTASHRTTIARDPSVVFDYIADAGRQQSWNPLVRSMDQESEGRLGVGTRWHGDIARVGKVEVELIEYDPPVRVVHTVRPWMAVATHIWEVQPALAGAA